MATKLAGSHLMSLAGGFQPSSIGNPPRHVSYVWHFLWKTLKIIRLDIRIPLPSDLKLADDFSSVDTAVLPPLCYRINALTSLLNKVDTLSGRLDYIQDSLSAISNTIVTQEKLNFSVAPIVSLVRNLSYRVSSVPSPIPARPTLNSARPPPPPNARP
ncbi:hypothetical protein B9Z19DRAFT_1066925 [Tuber borchii]|uniref:Uncharacterized protein n=1 Tax=Tuber borchii TaxID=42251 RepID=A0A2T6ZKR0_TUBBO|nr:hypothetical protein B9Z19DRAFT_1066925 [Tuber borchii]